MEYKCRDCGCLFDEPNVVHESRGEYWGVPSYEDMWYCPHCGSEDFDYTSTVEREEGKASGVVVNLQVKMRLDYDYKDNLEMMKNLMKKVLFENVEIEEILEVSLDEEEE